MGCCHWWIFFKERKNPNHKGGAQKTQGRVIQHLSNHWFKHLGSFNSFFCPSFWINPKSVSWDGSIIDDRWALVPYMGGMDFHEGHPWARSIFIQMWMQLKSGYQISNENNIRTMQTKLLNKLNCLKYMIISVTKNKSEYKWDTWFAQLLPPVLTNI